MCMFFSRVVSPKLSEAESSELMREKNLIIHIIIALEKSLAGLGRGEEGWATLGWICLNF